MRRLTFGFEHVSVWKKCEAEWKILDACFEYLYPQYDPVVKANTRINIKDLRN